jgi:hypothetical protein
MNRGSRRSGAPVAPWMALVIYGGLACSDAREPPQPASFDRPTDVDFVCVVNGRVAPLSECDIEAADRALHALVTQSARGEVAAVNLRTDRILDNRRDVPGFTFVQTGELPIAIVASRLHPELTYVASYGSRDVRVMRTEVLLGLSNEASEAQEAVSLTMDASGDADGGAFGGTPSDMVLLPDESALLVTLSDVGKVARLPLVDGGAVDEDGITFVTLPVTAPPAPTPVAAEDSYALICGDYQRPPLPPIPTPTAPLAASASRPVAMAIDQSCEGCGEGRLLIADEALPVLHVLDLAALAAGSDPLLAPIPTGAPTRDVVVTPRVPAAFVKPDPNDEDDTFPFDEGRQPIESTYFVYAIDGSDGTIMVLENDAVLAINRDPDGRVDRLPITHLTGAPAPLALTLEVITPELPSNPTGDPEYVDLFVGSRTIRSRELCTDDSHIKVSPRRLRGVFLTAALADGTVRVIDVHDRDLLNCRSCENAPEAGPIVVRHHPRLVSDPIAQEEADRDELLPEARAQVQVDTGAFNVRNNGSVASPLAPQLGCFPCDEGFVQALPDPDDQVAAQAAQEEDAGLVDDELSSICQEALVCGLSDPWSGSLDAYSFIYEGVLPNAGSGDGRFVLPEDDDNVTGVLELHASVPFCARGVLGTDDIAGARDAERCALRGDDLTAFNAIGGLLGDRVEIINEPLSDAALRALGRDDDEREQCAALRTKLDEDETATLSLEILAAFEDRLAVRQRLGAPFDARPLDLDWNDLETCLGDKPMTFRVRSQNGFLVFTANDGFEHNVIANAQGRCVVDGMSSAASSRRSWAGCAYKDQRLQLQLQPFTPDEGGIVSEPGDGLGAAIVLSVGTTAVPLLMNASQVGFGITTLVPSRLRYSVADQQLYLVDTYQGGLIPIELDPFRDTPITSFY